MTMKKLILASASKRRHDLLKNTGYNFDVIISNADESSINPKDFTPEQLVCQLARFKALSVVDSAPEDSVIIGSDTVVAFGGNILGKPKDEAEAFTMLKALSANSHTVYTGVFFYDKLNATCSGVCEAAKVHMSPMGDDEILVYIKTGQPMDKAGSYGIQGIGGLFVSAIEGDFFAIEGLPINKVYNELKKYGILPNFSNKEYI